MWTWHAKIGFKPPAPVPPTWEEGRKGLIRLSAPSWIYFASFRGLSSLAPNAQERHMKSFREWGWRLPQASGGSFLSSEAAAAPLYCKPLSALRQGAIKEGESVGSQIIEVEVGSQYVDEFLNDKLYLAILTLSQYLQTLQHWCIINALELLDACLPSSLAYFTE